LGESVAIDASGNVIVVGQFSGIVDFGGGPIAATVGGWDIFIAKYDAVGGYLWSKRFGDSDDQWLTSVAVDGAENILVTGYFHGGVDFGGGNLVSTDEDIFLAKFDPAGGYQWRELHPKV